MKIFIDLDGTYVAFFESLAKDFGVDISAHPQFVDLNGFATAANTDLDTVLQHINDRGTSFWEELETFPWSDRLYDLCWRFGEVAFLTCPATFEHAPAGKAKWFRKKFGPDFRGWMLASCKYMCAGPDAVLIDDNPGNCKAFAQFGGESILFEWKGSDDPIPEIERRLIVKQVELLSKSNE